MRISHGIQTSTVICAVILLLFGVSGILFAGPQDTKDSVIPLPSPEKRGDLSVESALQNRRSTRRYQDSPLSPKMLGQILWAAQGITNKREKPPAFWGDRAWPGGLRTAPSAGALYPLDVYAAVGNVEGLSPGVYRYLPEKHALEETADEDRRDELSRAALGQTYVRDAAVVLIVTGVYARLAVKYGERSQRYAHIETGAVGQNVFLQAEALGLGTVMVGAFRDQEVQSVLGLARDEIPLAIMPVGKKVP